MNQPSPTNGQSTALGGHALLQAYAKRTSFSVVHADLLLEAPELCTWASQEVVRWASLVRDMGRAVGMQSAALRAFAVQEYANRFNPTQDLPAQHLIDTSEAFS